MSMIGYRMRLAILALLGIFFQTGLSAQDVQPQNLKQLLCKKWEISYVLAGAAKINKGQGAPELVYEFKPDNSFVFGPDDPEQRSEGKWAYDTNKKWISLEMKDHPKATIISLVPGELILVNPKHKSPDDPENRRMVFHPLN
jgi:hypothetical protein